MNEGSSTVTGTSLSLPDNCDTEATRSVITKLTVHTVILLNAVGTDFYTVHCNMMVAKDRLVDQIHALFCCRHADFQGFDTRKMGYFIVLHFC